MPIQNLPDFGERESNPATAQDEGHTGPFAGRTAPSPAPTRRHHKAFRLVVAQSAGRNVQFPCEIADGAKSGSNPSGQKDVLPRNLETGLLVGAHVNVNDRTGCQAAARTG